MIIIFRHLSKKAETQHTLCKGPKCIGMLCFDPTEYTVSKQMKPFGNIFQINSFNWNLDYWFCRGFWNKEVLHSKKDICPDDFQDFDRDLMVDRMDNDWSFRLI